MSDRSMPDLCELEQRFFDQLLPGPAPAIFIVASPRTGSTLLYQVLARAFQLPFIDNLTNDYFPSVPIVGLASGKSLRQRDLIRFESRFGKSQGITQPSEGSAVMAHWFGGGHPSQVVSASILPGKTAHLRNTLSACYAMLAGPLLTKNPWNSFRVESIAREIPEAAFIWIRRDIRAAAKSDLLARYVVQGNPNSWNSATPANVCDLQARPYWEQVVENQYEFGKAIVDAASTLPKGQFAEIWHEDLVKRPDEALARLRDVLAPLKNRQMERLALTSPKREGELQLADAEAIERYVASQHDRFNDYLWAASK